MNKLSRRQLARWAADELLSGRSETEVAKNLAAALYDSRKLKDADLLANDIAGELEQRGAVAMVKVITARPLDETLRSQIEHFMAAAIKVSDVVLEESVDEGIIGGVHIETAAHSWDKSLRAKLNQIREAV